MRRGFTLLEALLAALILGLGLTAILVSLTQAQKTMLGSTEVETAQEVMDLGEMVYPLDEVKDMSDIEVQEIKATELWRKLTDEKLTRAQEEKFHGYTWQREAVNDKDADEIERLGGLCTVRVTVRWGDRLRGHGQKESYITFWRSKE